MNHGTLHHFDSDVFPSVVLGLTAQMEDLHPQRDWHIRQVASRRLTAVRIPAEKSPAPVITLAQWCSSFALYYSPIRLPSITLLQPPSLALAANIPNNSEPNRVFQLAPLLILKIATTDVTADRDSRTSFFRAVWAQNLVSLCALHLKPLVGPFDESPRPPRSDRPKNEQRAVVSGCQIHPTLSVGPFQCQIFAPICCQKAKFDHPKYRIFNKFPHFSGR